ncbi:MAG: CsgG/HfaB family protein [candidate division WOR-3 bacterium]
MKRSILSALLAVVGCIATTKPSDWAISPSYDFGRTYRVALVSEGGFLDEAAYNQVSLQLLKVGNLIVLERKRVEGVLSEQEFGVSGAVDPSSAGRIGSLTGADIVGFVSFSGGTVLVKLTDSETGEVLYMGQGMGPDFNTAAERALAPLLEEARKRK